MCEKNKDIALKAWEVYQELAKGMGESAWQIRSIYFATAAGLIAYTYNSSSPILYLLVSILCLLFFVIESGAAIIDIAVNIAIHLFFNFLIRRNARAAQSTFH